MTMKMTMLRLFIIVMMGMMAFFLSSSLLLLLLTMSILVHSSGWTGRGCVGGYLTFLAQGDTDGFLNA